MAKRKINGIFLLDKPEGISSSTALVRTRAMFKAQKGGHTGALDPLASGLLPICLGEAAKFSSFFLEGKKRYIAEGTLGQSTTTCDREGEIVATRVIGAAMSRLEEVLPSFCGPITQVPPIYSAVKVNGKPLYKYARQGRADEVEIPSRQVEIYELKLLEKTETTFTVEVFCSKGTYIRTLINDIGEALGCGAFVSKLRRTFVEGLPHGQMMPLTELQQLVDGRSDKNDFRALDAHLIPIEEALGNLPIVSLERHQAEPLSHGMRLKEVEITPVLTKLYHSGTLSPLQVNELFQVRYHDHFLGVCYLDEQGTLIPKRMMDPELMQQYLAAETQA